ncbi:hypothetical protein PR048_025129 [Dryococelus australis]|uniref:Uncharacterized protein n=1 Tax=Dryococelus australis TaxID=614101 RepID=A0ABQ9GQK6_9NEOP|nr:hypothetical protein PR048_025129 [Dryococelus australis]
MCAVTSIMQLFEAGIVSRITEKEYGKLGEKLRAAQGNGASLPDSGQQELAGGAAGGKASQQDGDRSKASSTVEEQVLQPMSMTMLQGAFLVLLMGYTLSGE